MGIVRRMRLLFAVWVFVASLGVLSAAPFELKEGDRVVFLGDTLMEREQHHGWIELMLTTRFPDRNVTFRNLGWSADLPSGESRLGLSLGQAGNEAAGEGWALLQKQITEAKPTVAFIGYGMAASFAGEAGLAKFKADYERLLDTMEKISPGCRFVLLGPIAHEWHKGLAKPDAANVRIAAYTEAIRAVASSRKVPFIPLAKPTDLGSVVGRRQPADIEATYKNGVPTQVADRTKITDNGIHLNSAGYLMLSRAIANALFDASVDQFESRVLGSTADALRAVILRKNEFFFHRSRPANMAYIFGFRKREQGNNAVEMPKFDPLIEVEEKKIRELCKHLGDANYKPGPELQPATLARKPAAAKLTPQPRPEFTVADGFEVTLWAENPLLAKPIQMNFDAQGRLWVASSEVYPQIEPGQAAHDKIIVLEDSNGGGRADKATVFADNMLIPTGLAPGDGGVYVAQSTELLHLKDTNGDGKADVRRIVLSSFGTEDTHHNLHTLRWGPDGRLWMNQSIYTRSEIETPHGIVRLRSGGILRLDTRTLELDVPFRGWVNAWGHQFDDFGQSFVTDGAGFKGINWAMPGATYFTYARLRRELQSISPGNYPKFASIELIRSEHFPADWQGRVVTCDFRANRVTSFHVDEQGAGYVTKQGTDLLRTANNTFRPIDVKLGPDGALYIADWSNPIIQHGEVDFRDPRRDHEHGRIWRVSVKGRQTKKPELAKASTAALLDELVSPNHFNSSQATRLLVEKGATAAELMAWTAKLKDEKQLRAALWIHQALNQPAPLLLGTVLNSKDGRIRAAAVRVLSQWGPQPTAADVARLVDASGSTLLPAVSGKPAIPQDDALTLLAKYAADAHPRVRAEALRALSRIPTTRAAELVLGAVDTVGADPFLDYAAWLSINDLAPQFLAAVESGKWVPDSPAKQRQIEFAMNSIEPALASGFLTKALAGKPLAKNGAGPWIELIGAAGGQSEIDQLWKQTATHHFSDEALQRALAALTSAARLRNLKPGGDASPGLALLSAAHVPTRVAFVNLLGAWKNPGAAFAEMVKQAGDANTPGEVRTSIFAAFRELGAIAPVLGALQPMTTTTSPAPVRRAAAITLASLQPSKFADLALDVMAETKTDAEALEIWRGTLATKGAAKQFADKVSARNALPAHVVSAGLRAARESAQPEQSLVAALTKLSNLAILSPDKLTPSRLKEMAEVALKSGDPARGERVYRRTELGCVLCHSIGGAGGKVGPDMTSIGASAPSDYLVESLLLPNSKIKEGFHGLTIETKDDLEYSGILVRESGQEVILRNAQNLQVSVAKNSIRKRANAQTSLMPAGLLDALPETERNDLIAFLSRLGKPGEFDASKGGVARLWKVLPGTHRVEQHGVDKIVAADFSKTWSNAELGMGDNAGWHTLPSRVAGHLALEDLQEITRVGIHIGLASVFVGTEFELSKAGIARFQLPKGFQTQAWLDGKPLRASEEFQATLAAGRHRIVLRLDAQSLPKALSLKSGDVTFLTE